MKAKELKQMLNKIDDNEDISFSVFDDYGIEVEGLKFKTLEKEYGSYYLTLSAYDE